MTPLDPPQRDVLAVGDRVTAIRLGRQGIVTAVENGDVTVLLDEWFSLPATERMFTADEIKRGPPGLLTKHHLNSSGEYIR